MGDSICDAKTSPAIPIISNKLADKIKSVSAEDIRRIAEKYLILDKAVLSIVHNQEMEEAFIRHAWEGKNSTLSQPKVRKSF
jgi:hypothetical protein